MTTLVQVRDAAKYRVHGPEGSFTVSRRDDSRQAQLDFGALSNQVLSSPVPDYDAELRIDEDTGRTFEIFFRRRD